jgi:nicotinamidase-related amidase
MSKIIRILEIILLSAVGTGIFVYFLVSSPTGGNKIHTYGKPKAAIMIMGVQEDNTGKNAIGQFSRSEEVIKANNELIRKAEAKGWEVVYIRQETPSSYAFLLGNRLVEGTPGADMDSRIKISGTIFTKQFTDAFWNKDMENHLINSQVNTIYLTGVSADTDLKVTAEAAKNRGYEVKIVKEAIDLENHSKMNNLLKELGDKGIKAVSMDDIAD